MMAQAAQVADLYYGQIQGGWKGTRGADYEYRMESHAPVRLI